MKPWAVQENSRRLFACTNPLIIERLLLCPHAERLTCRISQAPFVLGGALSFPLCRDVRWFQRGNNSEMTVESKIRSIGLAFCLHRCPHTNTRGPLYNS